jgi:hypothetical protein
MKVDTVKKPANEKTPTLMEVTQAAQDGLEKITGKLPKTPLPVVN